MAKVGYLTQDHHPKSLHMSTTATSNSNVGFDPWIIYKVNFSPRNFYTSNSNKTYFGAYESFVNCYKEFSFHTKLRSIRHVATEVHVKLRSFVVLTWMRVTVELV